MRASYSRAVEWIALNDETAIEDEIEMADILTVLLTADLWGKAPHEVARDVVRYRSHRPYPFNREV